jgi:retron-type reverse transcriptase
MNLGELILTLKPLLDDAPANAAKIVELLQQHQSLAEFEVARFYVSRAFAPVIEKQVTSPDPAVRKTAARGIGLVLARSDASRLLRRLVKDADPSTRGIARGAVKKLGLDDVGLPDKNFPKPRGVYATAIGGWNPTGWSFGLYKPRVWGGDDDAKPKKKHKARPTLPAIDSTAALVKFLGLKSEKAMKPLLRVGEGKGAPYIAFDIPKRSGGTRTIHAPRKALKTIQRKILDEIVGKIPTHDACHGFTPKRSTVTNAKPHLKAKLVLRVDLLDFFPTIHYRRVQGMFQDYGYSPPVAHVLAGLTTHRPTLPDGKPVWPGVLPQGAPTSPAIANVICRRLDARLSALAKGANAKYTRYADDLTFSFADDPKVSVGRFLWWVGQICQHEGFTENPIKRRVYRRHTQQRVTGIVVNDKLTVPREARRRFRSMLAHCKKEGLAAMIEKQPKLRAELDGFAAYVKMVQPDLGKKLAAQIAALGS